MMIIDTSGVSGYLVILLKEVRSFKIGETNKRERDRDWK